MENHVQYALQGSEVVHISEVESGLTCGCHCVSCGSALVAKKGSLVIHHFAHHNRNDCPTAFETSLHLGVKRVLEQEMQFRFPALKVEQQFGNPLQIYPAKLLRFTELNIEKAIDQVIPDLLIKVDNSQCMLEIYVTHKVDQNKLEKIKKLNIGAVEIDFSRIDREVDDEYIRDVILNGTDCKTWLFNPKAEALQQENRKKRENDIRESKNDKLKITSTEFHFLVLYGCPLLPRHKKQWSTSVIRDCAFCEHLVHKDKDYILCNARYEIWKKNHYRLIKTLGENAIKEYPNTVDYLNKLGVCPACGNLLVLREGKFGPFLACKGFPSCKFTRDIDPETGEIR